MHVLVLSFYFEPDLSAGSFRATALVEKLSTKISREDELTVIAAMPNRYSSFRAAAKAMEPRGNCTVWRIALPLHRSGILDQSYAFLTYARGVLRVIKKLDVDLVFATSSRLMTASLGALVARRRSVPLYLDIRDIFTDTVASVFAGKPQQTVLPLLKVLESWTLRSAARVNVVSGGFVEHFRAVRSDLNYRVFTNGIDCTFLGTDFRSKPKTGKRRVILYAGNIGEGQGLDRVVPEAATMLRRSYEFWIVGDGAKREQLAVALGAMRDNVRIMEPVPRNELIDLYRQADILFLHLNDYPAFGKVLPSKLFEYAATGKPILAGVTGYARAFVEDNIENASIFPPCDANALCSALATLDLAMVDRSDFKRRFERSAIIDQLADDVLDLVAGAA